MTADLLNPGAEVLAFWGVDILPKSMEFRGGKDAHGCPTTGAEVPHAGCDRLDARDHRCAALRRARHPPERAAGDGRRPRRRGQRARLALHHAQRHPHQGRQRRQLPADGGNQGGAQRLRHRRTRRVWVRELRRWTKRAVLRGHKNPCARQPGRRRELAGPPDGRVADRPEGGRARAGTWAASISSTTRTSTPATAASPQCPG